MPSLIGCSYNHVLREIGSEMISFVASVAETSVADH